MEREKVIRKLIGYAYLLRKDNETLEFEGVKTLENVDRVAEELDDLVIELIGFPEDNTIEMERKYKDEWINQPDLFCRDYLYKILLNGINPDDTYDLLIKEKKNLVYGSTKVS